MNEIWTNTPYDLINKLRSYTGVGMAMCKDAYKYAVSRDGGYNMMLAYVKAKSLAVYFSGTFDEKVDMFLRGLEKDNETVD